MIEVTAELIEQWSESQFEGLERDSLRAACRFLGIEAAPNTSVQGLKIRLQRHYGQTGDMPSVREVPKASFRQPPNFKILATWEGRKYRIKSHAPDREYGNRPFPIGWEGQVFMMDPRKPFQDVPAPIYYNLRDAKQRDLKTSWDNTTMSMRHDWLEFDRYPHTFMGITPGTETLPDDEREWFIRDAKAHALYADESRETLERIWARLTDGSRPNKEDRERNTDYWRREVLELLALTPEQVERSAAYELEMAA